MNDPLADLLLRIDGEAGGNRRLTQGWADDIAARLRAAGVTLAAPPSDPAAPLDDTAADWYRQGWEAGNKAPSDPAAPLDVERLARAMRAISLIPSLYRGPVAAWVPTAEALAREYAALAPKEAES